MTLDHDGGKTLLFGKPGDLVSSEDARLVALLLIEARLGSAGSGHSIKRSLEANVSVGNGLPATVGALYDRIEQLYGSRGWRVFQALYHEAAGPIRAQSRQAARMP